MVSTETAELVLGVLARFAGVNNQDPMVRIEFLSVLQGNLPSEWRFMGNLGSGGKFYVDPITGFRVDCYEEHKTPERENVIKTVNKILKDIRI